MIWSPYALGTRTKLWFGHGCSGQPMLLEHVLNYGLGKDALISLYALAEHDLAAYAGGRAKVLENPTAKYAPWTNFHTELWVCARRARALGAPGAKLLVSPLIPPIVAPYIIIPYITPFKEFRLQLILRSSYLGKLPTQAQGKKRALPRGGQLQVPQITLRVLG